MGWLAARLTRSIMDGRRPLGAGELPAAKDGRRAGTTGSLGRPGPLPASGTAAAKDTGHDKLYAVCRETYNSCMRSLRRSVCWWQRSRSPILASARSLHQQLQQLGVWIDISILCSLQDSIYISLIWVKFTPADCCGPS